MLVLLERCRDAAVDEEGVGARVELEPRVVAAVVGEGEGAGFAADVGDEGGLFCSGGCEGEAAEADDAGGQAEFPDHGAQLGREGGEVGKGGGHFCGYCVFMCCW